MCLTNTIFHLLKNFKHSTKQTHVVVDFKFMFALSPFLSSKTINVH